jgi:hypothetical protein
VERERQGMDKKEKRNKEIKQGTVRGRRGEAKLPGYPKALMGERPERWSSTIFSLH